MSSLLKIKNLKVKVEDKEILKGVDLEINKGEVHVIMGPNGAGKSTLSNAITGNPKYEIIDGEIIFEGEKINELKVDERAKKGIFMSFQYPEAIPGVTVEEFLRAAKSSITGKLQSVIKFKKELKEKMQELHIDETYANRHLNVGFSGGEKKKNEILQMAVLEPKLAILDETDSGLDVDAIKVVYEGVNKLKNENNAILIITHYNKVLNYIKPDFVHVVNNGKIVKSGGIELAHEIEEQGYENIKVM
ncbi:MAG: Fe-S cluster assembly ATP-binding protein [Fusobacteriaceae bacterium]|jgi:Fe-S cluster assembly ATP-binding protein|nr:FeS assembly ATPase SufC [Fusobacteriales bacterium]MDN5303888.1 Fe-S cluster assembly ATP-binding protein [Fusobacteriaceae bacterium]